MPGYHKQLLFPINTNLINSLYYVLDLFIVKLNIILVSEKRTEVREKAETANSTEN